MKMALEAYIGQLVLHLNVFLCKPCLINVGRLNFAVRWMALLFLIWEVPGLNIGAGTGILNFSGRIIRYSLIILSFDTV